MLHTPLGRRLAALAPRTKLAMMIAADALFLPLCVLAAVALRLGSLGDAVRLALPIQLALGLLTLPVLAMAGLYRAVLRYIDMRVLVAASTALAIAVLMIYGTALALDLRVIPRSSLLVYWFIAFTYVISSRFLARTLLRRSFESAGRPRQRTAIYGAGEAGTQLARAMQTSPEYEAVCFIDDKSGLRHRTVAGLRVYSPDEIDAAMALHDVAQIVVAIPSSTPARRRQLITRVEHTGLPVKILPGLLDMVDGLASVSDIREVDVADLLGRDPVPPQPMLFSRDLTDKVVLVTGAGGSIGSELCRQIATQRPRKLVLLDHAEYSLYAIDHELHHAAHGFKIVAILGSVLDEPLLARVLAQHAVQTVYHAAAYKHVPLVEANMQQGLRNNVFGSLAVARAAATAGVATCVLISTDKAVRPTNVMGASKRIAELVFQAAAQRGAAGTTFSMVRFGNVLGSSGSVVPLFKRQIQAGGPITITHPDIIRYFMLIPEAAQLVIQAGAMARGGEVFVLDMGEPVRIADLARTMIHLSGLSERTPDDPNGDIEIAYVGLRPGEKLFEELLIGDDVVPSDHARIQCARERHIEPALLDKMLQSLRVACDVNEPAAMLRQVQNLVPEYRSADEVNAEVAAQMQSR
jgi:FlaA1/EpsC-like NDP-sugar epimerase